MKKSSWKGKTKADIVFDLILVILCICVFFVIAYPLWFVIIASISDSNMVATGQVILWPRNISFFGFEQVFADTRIWVGYRNTILYAGLGTAFSLLLTFPAAYVLSRKEFVARRFLMLFFVFTMFFNGGMIPTFLLMRDVGFLNTIWVFIIPFAVNIFNLIIVRTFFENSIPSELYDAAQLDGASHFYYFTRVVLPLSKAVIAIMVLYYLVQRWNDFFTGLIYIRDSSMQPLQVILRDILLAGQAMASGAGSVGAGYAQQYANQIMYAVIIVSTLPVLIVYPFIQKHFAKGVMVGAVKG